MIPKILHTYWEGGRDERVQDTLQAWRDLHPDYEMRSWTPDIHPCKRLADQFDTAERYCYSAPLFRSNLVRYEALWREGGVWIDGDMAPVRNIDELMDFDAFIALDRPGSDQLQTAIMGMAHCHALAESLIQEQLHLPPHPPRRLPGVLVVNKVARGGFPGLKILPSSTFYPYDRNTGITLTDPARAYGYHIPKGGPWQRTEAS